MSSRRRSTRLLPAPERTAAEVAEEAARQSDAARAAAASRSRSASRKKIARGTATKALKETASRRTKSKSPSTKGRGRKQPDPPPSRSPSSSPSPGKDDDKKDKDGREEKKDDSKYTDSDDGSAGGDDDSDAIKRREAARRQFSVNYCDVVGRLTAENIPASFGPTEQIRNARTNMIHTVHLYLSAQQAGADDDTMQDIRARLFYFYGILNDAETEYYDNHTNHLALLVDNWARVHRPDGAVYTTDHLPHRNIRTPDNMYYNSIGEIDDIEAEIIAMLDSDTTAHGSQSFELQRQYGLGSKARDAANTARVKKYKGAVNRTIAPLMLRDVLLLPSSPRYVAEQARLDRLAMSAADGLHSSRPSAPASSTTGGNVLNDQPPSARRSSSSRSNGSSHDGSSSSRRSDSRYRSRSPSPSSASSSNGHSSSNQRRTPAQLRKSIIQTPCTETQHSLKRHGLQYRPCLNCGNSFINHRKTAADPLPQPHRGFRDDYRSDQYNSSDPSGLISSDSHRRRDPGDSTPSDRSSRRSSRELREIYQAYRDDGSSESESEYEEYDTNGHSSHYSSSTSYNYFSFIHYSIIYPYSITSLWCI